jgi:hypothetical protein
VQSKFATCHNQNMPLGIEEKELKNHIMKVGAWVVGS